MGRNILIATAGKPNAITLPSGVRNRVPVQDEECAVNFFLTDGSSAGYDGNHLLPCLSIDRIIWNLTIYPERNPGHGNLYLGRFSSAGSLQSTLTGSGVGRDGDGTVLLTDSRAGPGQRPGYLRILHLRAVLVIDHGGIGHSVRAALGDGNGIAGDGLAVLLDDHGLRHCRRLVDGDGGRVGIVAAGGLDLHSALLGILGDRQRATIQAYASRSVDQRPHDRLAIHGHAVLVIDRGGELRRLFSLSQCGNIDSLAVRHYLGSLCGLSGQRQHGGTGGFTALGRDGNFVGSSRIVHSDQARITDGDALGIALKIPRHALAFHDAANLVLDHGGHLNGGLAASFHFGLGGHSYCVSLRLHFHSSGNRLRTTGDGDSAGNASYLIF